MSHCVYMHAQHPVCVLKLVGNKITSLWPYSEKLIRIVAPIIPLNTSYKTNHIIIFIVSGFHTCN